MKLVPSALAAILPFLSADTAVAGSLTLDTLSFTAPAGLSVGGNGTTDFTFTGFANGYNVSGEFCVAGFCGGGSGPAGLGIFLQIQIFR
jgi:hypothetical protein